MKHLLSVEQLPRDAIESILTAARTWKAERRNPSRQPLTGQTWALLFSKSSTRTRVSFEVGIRELGGQSLFLSANDIQLGRGELIKDTARVLGRMIHGAVIRTFAQADVEEFAAHSGIPTINALTDQEHPCQILTDIFTFQEKRGSIQGKVVTFVGDGVFALVKNQDTKDLGIKGYIKTYGALEDYGVEHFYVDRQSMEERGLTEADFAIPAQVVDSDEIGRLMDEQHACIPY